MDLSRYCIGAASKLIMLTNASSFLYLILSVVEGHLVKRVYSLNEGVRWQQKQNQAGAGKGIPSSTRQSHWPWRKRLGLRQQPSNWGFMKANCITGGARLVFHRIRAPWKNGFWWRMPASSVSWLSRSRNWPS